MKKEFWLSVFVFIVMLFGMQTALASVTISEIMYDPDGSDTNREWVELYNDGGSSVDLSAWKFVEANTNHGLTSYSGGVSISSGGYAIIALEPATFVGEWGGDGAPVFDASFSLGNAVGEALSLKDADGNIVYTVTYDPTIGASDDGNSLQKYSGSWVTADPTAGKSNSTADVDASGGDTGGSDDGAGETNDEDTMSAVSVPVEAERIVVHDEWQLSLFAPSYGIAGSPATFTTDVRNLYDEKVHPGRYVWNMGDGTIYDGKEFENITHTYEYAGDYVVILDYWRPGSFEKKVTVRYTFSVKVGALTISAIVKANNVLDVQIKNAGGDEVDLSGWLISSQIHAYFIPENTIILGNKTITFASRSTGFAGTDSATLALSSPNGEVVATTVPAPTKSISTVQKATGTVKGATIGSIELLEVPENQNSSLAANVTDATQSNKNLIWWLSALGLVALGVVSFIFLKVDLQKKKEGDEFEIKLVK